MSKKGRRNNTNLGDLITVAVDIDLAMHSVGQALDRLAVSGHHLLVSRLEKAGKDLYSVHGHLLRLVESCSRTTPAPPAPKRTAKASRTPAAPHKRRRSPARARGTSQATARQAEEAASKRARSGRGRR